MSIKDRLVMNISFIFSFLFTFCIVVTMLVMVAVRMVHSSIANLSLGKGCFVAQTALMNGMKSYITHFKAVGGMTVEDYIKTCHEENLI
jgi:hypothetical protein